MPPIDRLIARRPIVATNHSGRDRPAMARAPHRDPDGRGLAARGLTGGRDGHRGSLRRQCFHHDNGLETAGGEREQACALELERRAVGGAEGSKGSIVSVARPPARAIRHVPAYMPSTRIVPIDAPLPGGSGMHDRAG